MLVEEIVEFVQEYRTKTGVFSFSVKEEEYARNILIYEKKDWNKVEFKEHFLRTNNSLINYNSINNYSFKERKVGQCHKCSKEYLISWNGWNKEFCSAKCDPKYPK